MLLFCIIFYAWRILSTRIFTTFFIFSFRLIYLFIQILVSGTSSLRIHSLLLLLLMLKTELDFKFHFTHTEFKKNSVCSLFLLKKKNYNNNETTKKKQTSICIVLHLFSPSSSFIWPWCVKKFHICSKKQTKIELFQNIWHVWKFYSFLLLITLILYKIFFLFQVPAFRKTKKKIRNSGI